MKKRAKIINRIFLVIIGIILPFSISSAWATDYTLTITKSGTGTGTVTSTPGGIDCGSTCSTAFPSGASVTLTASPAVGSSFTSWSGGGCSGSETCMVVMDGAKTVKATFASNPAFDEYQSILTHGATSWKSFTIDGQNYLAVANCYNGTSFNIDSKIYKWNGMSFVEFQSIPTSCAQDWESFAIDGIPYLAVINNTDGSTGILNSRIYKWNGTSFVEFQSILTSAAADWENFTIGGQTYLAVVNYYGDSKIYKWNGSSFVEFQSIATQGGSDWENFSIDGVTYLAVANTFNGSTSNIDSKIYKWNGTSFVEFQSIATQGGSDWESFTIDGVTYLAVANWREGTSVSYNIDSKIYKWNGSSFVEFQSIPTNGALDWKSFTINGVTYLVVANYYNGSSKSIDSRIYRWNGTSFVEFQSIPTDSVNGWESFTIDGQTYLAVANAFGPTGHNTASRIYKWNGLTGLTVSTAGTGAGTVTSTPSGIDCGSTCGAEFIVGTSVTLTANPAVGSSFTGWSGGYCSGSGACTVVMDGAKTVKATFASKPAFDEYQSILTHGAKGWKTFTINGATYLAIANFYDGSNYNINSIIYKWNGISFEEFQSIPTSGACDWESFTIDGVPYLAIANYFDGSSSNINSKIYRWNGTFFVEFQSIATQGGYDWESFVIDGVMYLAVANNFETTWNTDSKIYKWNGTSFVDFQSIATQGGIDWESFTIDGMTYLAAANFFNDITCNIDSKIYRWNGTSFVEFQSIATQGGFDWESFVIDGVTYLAVANWREGSVNHNIDSKIYKWNGSSFVEFQSIPTNGAVDWKSFVIDGVTYLAVANYHNGSTQSIDSRIYKWNGTSFVEFQTIPTESVNGLESFTVDGQTYLAVANGFFGTSGNNTESRIYKWNGTNGLTVTKAGTGFGTVTSEPVGISCGTDCSEVYLAETAVTLTATAASGSTFVGWSGGGCSGTGPCAVVLDANKQVTVTFSAVNPTFTEIQAVLTNGAIDWESFDIDGQTYLAVANYYNGTDFNLDSKIYKWNGTSFTEIQSIATYGGYAWKSFVIAGQTYLAIANSLSDQSKIYKWNGTSFVEFQSVTTYHAYDWEHFSINGEHYLAVANYSNGSSWNIDSKIYKWNGSSFAAFQSISTSGATDWESFTIDGQSFLAVANSFNGSTNQINSKIYKWNGSAFAAFQSILTTGAFDWEIFVINGETYLAAGQTSSDENSVDSKIYKWNGTSFTEFQVIPTKTALDWESFVVGGETYLAVTNFYGDSTYNTDSKIYKWNGTSFVEFQALSTSGAADIQSFFIDGLPYLAIANHENGTSYNIDSKIYQWNVVRSLSVAKAGTGTGTVTSTPSGIDCGTDCNEGYAPGASVTLTAVPDGNFAFTGWSGGGCSGTGTCNVTMDAAKTVTANFNDTTPPSCTMTINGVSACTNTTTTSVTLTNASSDATEMQFSDDNVVWSAPEPFSITKSWTLPLSDGTKTVYAKCKDAAGNWSDPVVTDTINLDTTPPTVTANPAGGIYNGAQSVTLSAGVGETIYYTLDGTDPKTSPTRIQYAEPININCSTVLKHYGVDDCGNAGSVVTETYTINYILTVAKNGTGTGTVLSNPMGIDCGADCTEAYNCGTQVTLTATPDNGSEFAVWSGGGCTGTGVCTVTMNTAKTVTATFNDTKEPECTVTINSGAACTNVTLVNLSNSCPDSDATQMRFSNDNVGWSAPEPFNATKSWTLPSGDSNKTVYAKFRDAAGNWSSSPETDTITLDTTPPTVTANPPGGTYSGAQTVTLTANEPATIYYTLDGTDPKTSPTRVQYAAPVNINASKTLKHYALDSCGNSGSVVPVTYAINYTLTVTKMGTGTGSVSSNPAGIDCGATCSAAFSSIQSATLTAVQGAGSSFGSWSGCDSTNGNQCTVSMSSARSVTATFNDTTPPYCPITINGGAACTNTTTTSVTLTNASSDATEMKFSNDNVGWTSSEPFKATKEWTLLSGDGTKTVYARCKDAAGNWSDPFTDTIVLDTTPPTVTANPAGGTYNGAQSVTLSAGAGDTIYYTLDGTDPKTSQTKVQYTAPVGINCSKALKHYGVDNCGNTGSVVTETYTISYTLTVAKNGTGTGTVSSNPVGIDCGADCTEAYNCSTQVTLTATPGTDSTFVGWSGGGCTGTGVCTVTMDMAKTVTATFNDTTPPECPITINGGAACTNTTTTSVTLTNASSDAMEMRFSDDNIGWSAPEPFSATKSWTLPSGEGTKTVYARCKDAAGNWSDPFTDTIVLDTTPPTVTANPPGGTYYNAQNVTLSVTETATIFYTTDGSEPTMESFVYNKGDDEVPINISVNTTLKFFARDGCGNASAPNTQIYVMADYSLAVMPDVLNIVQGDTRLVTIILASINGFNLPVTLSYNAGSVPEHAVIILPNEPVTPTREGARVTLQFTAASNTPIGSYTLRITATATSKSETKDVHIVIRSPLAIATPSLPIGTKGQPYAAVIVAADGIPPYVFSKTGPGSLPDGLILAADGTLSGTPTARGQFPFKVQVQDNEGHTALREYNVRIYDPTYRKLVFDPPPPWEVKKSTPDNIIFSQWIFVKLTDDYDALAYPSLLTQVDYTSESPTGMFYDGSGFITSPWWQTYFSQIRFKYKDITAGSFIITASGVAGQPSESWVSVSGTMNVIDNGKKANLTISADDSIYGQGVTLTGTLTDAETSAGLAYRTVNITFTSPSGTVTPSAAVLTGSTGWFTYTAPPSVIDRAGQWIVKGKFRDNEPKEYIDAFTEDGFQVTKADTNIVVAVMPTHTHPAGQVTVSGQLSSSMQIPTGGLLEKDIVIELTAPDGTVFHSTTEKTDIEGRFEYEYKDGFPPLDSCTVKVSFAGDTNLNGDSETVILPIISSPGYVILIQGDYNAQSMNNYSASLDDIYKKAINDRTILAENILYLSYPDATHETNVNVNLDTTKGNVQWAITEWAANRMILSGIAPLWIIMIDHGSKGFFHIDQDDTNHETISPDEIDSWITTLETRIQDDRHQPVKTVVVIGACYSGSFIPALSKQGRIIITSSAEDEISIQGPPKTNGKFFGEWFIYYLFDYLSAGDNVQDAFRDAAKLTHQYRSCSGATCGNSSHSHVGNTLQHPLLDDNGDGQGSWMNIVGQEDGYSSAMLFFGLGTNPVSLSITEVMPTTKVMKDTEPFTIYAKTSDHARTATMWVEVKKPSYKPPDAGGAGPIIIELPTIVGTPNDLEERWEFTFTGDNEPRLNEAGTYTLYYYAMDSNGDILFPVVGTLFVDAPGNNPPSPFDLESPENNSEINDAMMIFQWKKSTDPEGGPVTYTLKIYEDSNGSKGNEIKRYELITTKFHFFNAIEEKRNDGKTRLFTTDEYYWWEVEAIDANGASATSEARKFHVIFTNALSGVITGIVFSDRDHSRIIEAILTAYISGTVKTESVTDGDYISAASPGEVDLVFEAEGYQRTVVSDVIVTPGEAIIKNIAMTPKDLTLTVTTSGMGTGRVVSSPAGIDCEPTCDKDFTKISKVTLTAIPDVGSRLLRWTGACTERGTCTVEMGGMRSVGATFTVLGDVDGSGTLDLTDAVLVLQAMMRKPPQAPFSIHNDADIDGDGSIGIEEAIYIMKKMSGNF